MLRLLDVQPDHRVLEVGTGSGYSTALLAHLVGAGGQVISLDIDPEMVTRAGRLLTLDGLSQEQQIAAGFIPLTATPLRPWEDDNSPPG